MIKSLKTIMFCVVSIVGVGSNYAYAQMSGNVDRLKADLYGDNMDRAVAAASALGSLNDAKAGDALISALQLGSPPRLTIALIEAVGNRKDVQTLDLLRHYAGHRNHQVRLAALTGLAEMDNPEIVPVLLDTLGDSHPMVRASAARILAEKKAQQAIPILFKMLKCGDVSAAIPLGKLGGVETAKQLGELMGDVSDAAIAKTYGEMLKRADFGPDPLRVQVIKALAKIPGSEATTALIDYITSVPEQEVRLSKKMAEELIERRKQ